MAGALGGYGLAALVVLLRRHDLLEDRFDGFVAIAAPLLIYGLAEALGAVSGEGSAVVWTALACVAVSIVVHGVTGSPLSRRVDDDATAVAGRS